MRVWRQRTEAVKALRLNLRWRGVARWMASRDRVQTYCDGTVELTRSKVRGWRLLWSDPERVMQEQWAIADGVFV